MIKPFAALFTSVLTLMLVGCSSPAPQPYRPLSWNRPLQVCLLDNPDVRPQVYLTIRRALLDKHFEVHRVNVDEHKRIDQCRRVLSYEAIYGSGLCESTLRYIQLTLREQAIHTQTFTVQWDERSYKPTLLDDVTDPNIEIRLLVDRLFPESLPWK